MYYLWSTKFHGWVSLQANYTTDLTEARSFTRDEAIEYAKRHKNGSVSVLLPVSDQDLGAI